MSMQAGFRPKNGYGGFSREQAAKHKSTGGGGGGGGGARITGLYDSYWPTMHNVWISLCPDQRWESAYWNRDTKEVEQLVAEYMAHVVHYVGATRRKFICSATPYLNCPCYGCSERQRFFDRRRQVQEETGTIPDNMKNAPISAMLQFGMSVTMLEEMGEFPKLDRNTNQPIKSQRGAGIYNWLPISAMKAFPNVQPRAKTFGHRFWWAFGTDHLTALVSEAEKLGTYCAHCAGKLSALYGTCQGESHDGSSYDAEGNPVLTTCGNFLFEEVDHGDLLDVVRQTHECGLCGHDGPAEITYSCENCGINCRPGGLFEFELKLGARSDDDHTPVVYAFRPRQDYSHIDGHEVLIHQPLDIKAICGPTKVQWQKDKLAPERAKLATPDAHVRKPAENGDQNLGAGADTSEVTY